jgi:hypothetical protein
MINVPRLIQKSSLYAIVLVAAAFASLAAHAQNRTPLPPAPSVQAEPNASDSNPPGLANLPPDPNHVRMAKSMAEERNAIRQKQIVDDTQHLLDLAKQLKDAVDKSSKDQLSLAVVNTASEIEKLAKTVKEKMRDGQ